MRHLKQISGDIAKLFEIAEEDLELGGSFELAWKVLALAMLCYPRPRIQGAHGEKGDGRIGGREARFCLRGQSCELFMKPIGR